VKKIKPNKSPKAIDKEEVIDLQTFGYVQLYRCTNCSNLQVYDEQCVLCHISPRIFKLERVSFDKEIGEGIEG
jgi:hypothetical protein